MTVFECKDLTRKVGLGHVEAFVTKLEDINANKGIVVSASDFTSPAMDIASAKNIELYELMDTRNHDWRKEVVVSLFVVLTGFGEYAVSLTDELGSSLRPNPFPVSPGEVELFDDNGTFVSYIFEEMMEAWNTTPKNDIVFGKFLPLILDDQRFVKIDGRLIEARVEVKLMEKHQIYKSEHAVHAIGFKSLTEEAVHFSELGIGIPVRSVFSDWEKMGDVDIHSQPKTPFYVVAEYSVYFSEEEICKNLPNRGVHRLRRRREDS